MTRLTWPLLIAPAFALMTLPVMAWLTWRIGPINPDRREEWLKRHGK